MQCIVLCNPNINMLYNFLAKILSCTVLLGMAEVWGALNDQDRAAHWCIHEESGP